MFIEGKLMVDDESYNILHFNQGSYQEIQRNGLSCADVVCKPLSIEIETTEETNLYAWAASKLEMKEVKIVLSHPSLTTKSRTIELYDTLCVGYCCDFNSEGTNPMVTRLSFSPGIIVENGEVMVERDWKITDLSSDSSTNSSAEQASFDDYYIVDEDNNKIEELSPGMNIEVVVKTTGKNGKTINIDLSNERVDFEYQGKVLVNDVLEGFTIGKDIERIPLKVIKQQNQNQN